jgi:cytochrome oxidase assembly protein ShyY1
VNFGFLAKPKWIAWTLVVVVAVVVMANLSLWQWGRLHDRRETNAAIEARANDPVVDVDDPSVAGAGGDDLRYRQVTATGTYLPDDEVLVANQTLGGAPGWWVVTPLRTTGGLVVLVNRGWVPFASVTPEGSFEAFAPPSGEVAVAGLVQTSQQPVPDADLAGRAVSRLDVALLAGRVGAGDEVAPWWLQLAEQQPAQPGSEPITLTLPPLDDGPHLNYAGQWAIFASLTAIIYLVLVIRTAQRGGDGAGSARRAGVARHSDPALLVPLAVRLAPLTGVDRLASVADLPAAEVTVRLDELVADGRARRHDADPAGWTLTPAGHLDLEQRLAAELDATGARPVVEAAHARFTELNQPVLQVCSDWQVVTDADGVLRVNDHTDADRDAALVARLGELADQAVVVCDELAAVLARFDSYRHRLDSARRRVESGETRWFDAAVIDSFHTVWFELHEHLLATLGIERGRQPAAPGASSVPTSR